MFYRDPDYFKHYYLRNREKLLARKKARYQADPEKIKAQERAYKLRHADKVKRRNRAYHLAHPDLRHARQKQRRAMKAGAPRNDLTHAQWVEIQDAQDHRCYYCGKRCKGKLTQDHITPLSQGGSHTLHNVIGACRSCNSKKKDGHPIIPVQPLLLTKALSRKKKAS